MAQISQAQNLGSTSDTYSHAEGKFTRAIEQQTAKIPSGTYLTLAIASMAISAGFAVFAEKKTIANFVGLWAPSILLLGLYNKIVKLEGSDRFSNV